MYNRICAEKKQFGAAAIYLYRAHLTNCIFQRRDFLDFVRRIIETLLTP